MFGLCNKFITKIFLFFQMKNIFIIEHLEPQLWPWCLIEYKQISKIVGKENLWFTNVRKNDRKKLEKYGKVFSESVKEMELKDCCVLDPAAGKTLVSSDSGEFRYFIFGGILGDYPPRKRTSEELSRFLPSAEKRNIGKEQFSTDNAVFVVHEILRGKKLSDLKFQDELEIKISDVESVILPFSYPVVNGKARISKELVEFIKKKKAQF